jgi:uncharacterized PurR-regulated membrane protein YhhQ (DUF165 family)
MLGLLGSVVAANWALERFGVVSVGFGLSAPAGVFFAGLTFGLRDVLHETAGRAAVVAAIVAGALLSAAISPSLAVASGVAFGVSEAADFAVYTPLRERFWWAAVAASNTVGAVVDSALFLVIAFGSLEHMAGQVVGKTYMTALALPVVWLVRRRPKPAAQSDELFVLDDVASPHPKMLAKALDKRRLARITDTNHAASAAFLNYMEAMCDATGCTFEEMSKWLDRHEQSR